MTVHEGYPNAGELITDVKGADGVMGGITLSEWESEFIDSISMRSTLTMKQLEVLRQIWDRI